MPRPKKEPVVIPTTSLVASAARYTGKAARIYQPNQNWQAECYRHYAICGEARFAAQFYGHSLSRAKLSVAKKGTDGLEPSDGGPGVDALAALFNGADGQAQMLTSLGIHLTIAGECYLVGRTVEGEDVWEIVSIMEMKVAGTKWMISYGDAQSDVILEDKDVVIRIWMPNPARRIEADSPFRSLLPILTEIEWLTRHIFAQTSSRLAGAGILFLPQGMTFPTPPAVDGAPQVVGNEADGFTLVLGENMLTPINDPSSPAAMIPIIVTAPDESIDKAKLMHFWSDLDAASLEMRAEAIRRFALGIDLPPEQILGMGNGTGGGTSNGISHWGAWQVDESTIKMHVEPKLELVVNALTMGYLRPLTMDPDEVIVYDTSALRLRPDRSKEAIELYNLGAISREALIRENGFDPADAPEEAEYQEWLLRKVASGSATPEQVAAALKALGVDLGPIETQDGPTGPETREARPDPSLEDHPTRTAPEAALLAASDALVFRALERAGNRIRQQTGVKPPGVASFAMHTLHHVNGDADSLLADAWACAPQVLDGVADVEPTVATLDAYVRSLFASQVPHKRWRLEKWLTA